MTSPTRGTLVLICLLAMAGCKNQPNSEFEPTPGVVTEHNRAVALMGKFDYGQAHTLFSKLAEENPNWQGAKVDLAIATLNRQQPGDDKNAAEILASVIEKEPDNLRAKYCRGILYLYASEPEPALEMFRTVADADPTDAYALYYTGQCHFQLGRYAEALKFFLRAQETDSYLRSAYYGAFQASQQLDNMDAAQGHFESFQKLEDNPQARLAEIKYTRMGPKAEVRVIDPDPAPIEQPTGPLFAETSAIEVQSDSELRWRSFDDASKPTITACDLNHDGELDLFIAGGLVSGKQGEGESPNAVLLSSGGKYELAPNHPLANVPGVNAVLWGDIDNDGLTDVYFCRSGPNQLWQQSPGGDQGETNVWTDITESSGTSGGEANTVDGACFDADHDGDLDLFLLNDGPNELLNNNLDGTFRTLATDQGIAGSGNSRGIVLGDFDSDRDVDLLVVNEHPPHEAYRNDRLWNYDAANGFDAIRVTNIWSAVSADTDADGKTEIFAVGPDGITKWVPNGDGGWSSREVSTSLKPVTGPIAVQDLTGDGQAEIVVTTSNGWGAISLDGETIQDGPSSGNWTLVPTNEAGYSILSPSAGAVPCIAAPGPGRFPVALLSFSGKENKADQMRTNASGVGVQAAIRVGRNWTTANTFRAQSGPGQSLQPVAVGLRGAKQMDFVSVRWPDGVFQSETDLDAGSHLITETQRQVSSCPIVFAWNGEEFQFVTDVLGVGGLGFNHGRGEYHPPRPWENLLIPDGVLHPMDGEYVIKLGEPMEEVMYLDAARLVVYDLPAGWKMVLDERMATNDPQPTGQPIFYRTEHLPRRALNSNGNEVTALVGDSDGVAVDPGPIDRRFLGRTAPHQLTLEFDKALKKIENPVLVFDGWVEYPYSQTMFAAWQANATYDSLSLEARDAKDKWHTIYDKFGYMAGMPRRSALPIDSSLLPEQTSAIRLSSNLELYLDAVSIVEAEPCEGVRRSQLAMTAAIVSEIGFPKRTNGDQKRPFYHYSSRQPLWDTRHLRGGYSSFGNNIAQVHRVDDESSVIGPGEEIELRFAAICAKSTPDRTQQFVLETNGWCKDRDLFTQFSESVKPIPSRTSTKKKIESAYSNSRYRD